MAIPARHVLIASRANHRRFSEQSLVGEQASALRHCLSLGPRFQRGSRRGPPVRTELRRGRAP
eukprot:5391676-Pyramimonas_sp.AAC.1